MTTESRARSIGPFRVRLDALQPSQLYVNEDKLRSVAAGIANGGGADGLLLPVVELDGRVVLTDGHTRALAAHRAGIGEIAVRWDEDDLDWELYRICVGWCLAEGIRSVPDLNGRVIDAGQYEELWRKRCRAAYEDLAARRRK